jgi:hypothetical protein
VMASLPRLRGAFALAIIFDGEEDLLIGARDSAKFYDSSGKALERHNTLPCCAPPLAMLPLHWQSKRRSAGKIALRDRSYSFPNQREIHKRIFGPP